MAVPSTVIKRFELGATFEEFNLAASRKGFIGPRALRPRVVGLQAADIGKIPIEALLQTRDDSRAPGAGYRRLDYEFESFSYSTKEKGIEAAIDDRTLAVYRDLIDAEVIASDSAKDAVLRNFEIACAAALYDTSVWTGAALTTGLSNAWSTHSSSAPIDNIFAAKQKVINGSGQEPNTLIMNDTQFFHCRESAQIVDRLKYSGMDDPKAIGPAQLAEMFDLDFVLVAGGGGSVSLKNTANQGQAASLGRIWGDGYMMLAKVAVSDDPQEPCVGRTFLWSGDGNPGSPGSESELAVVMEEYRDESRRSTIMRARNDRDIVIMYPECGHLLTAPL